MLDLRPAPLDHPDAVRLIAELQEVYWLRYGDGDITPLHPREFAAPEGLFVVAYLAATAVGCGGWRARDGADDPVLRAGDAEIKRMYVVAGHRGHGFGRQLLAELERTAVAAGRLRTVLETGTRQPEAIALYRSAGYTPMPNFGLYRDAPQSRCFAKVHGRCSRAS